jgi:ketosteroid isomerase-like protein
VNDELRDFLQFMKSREQASDAYVQGDPEPLGRMVARQSDATFFGPKGGFEHGPEEVWSRYERDAHVFERESSFRFEILQSAASDGIAYWVGFMRGKARLRGKPEPVPMELRVTELFRREGGEWKLVHRHADALARDAP